MVTVSARQIQRDYKGLFEKANRIKEPIVVMSNNKPQGAVIGLDLLERIRIQEVLNEALNDLREGKVETISTREELEAEFSRIRKLARGNNSQKSSKLQEKSR